MEYALNADNLSYGRHEYNPYHGQSSEVHGEEEDDLEYVQLEA